VAGPLGASTIPNEVLQAIEEVPAFAEQGRFNAPRYRAVLRETLGLTPPQYEAFVTHQITLFKIGSLANAASWISPLEISDELAGWTDRLTVQVATVSNRYENAPMPLTEERLRQYYEKNRRQFALPDRVGVRYVTLPVSNFLASVKVADEDVLDYYESHAATLTRTTSSNTVETLTLDEARPEIVAALQMDEARYIAATNASFSFVDALLQADPNGLDKIAAERELTVYSTALFGAGDPLPGIESLNDFRNTAFELDPARSDSRYGVVQGDKVIYVMTPYTNDAARVPSFEEAIDRVRPAAVTEARAEAFRARLKDLHEELQSTLREGKAFSFAAQKQALNVSTVFTFSVHALKRDAFDHTFAVVSEAMPLKRGELSSGAAIPGGALLVYMADRTPGESIEIAMMRDAVRSNLEQRREGLLFGDWLSWNLARLGFNPARGLVPQDTAAYDGDAEDD
jgi:hypothetical protein